MRFPTQLFLALTLVLATRSIVAADEIDAQIAIVAKTGAEGKGSPEAQQACRELAKVGLPVLPKLLSAMDTQNIVAANWLRSVYDEVVTTGPEGATRLPLPLLKDFVRDPNRQGRVRRHVLATLDKVEPQFGRELIPTFLDDPEFR